MSHARVGMPSDRTRSMPTQAWDMAPIPHPTSDPPLAPTLSREHVKHLRRRGLAVGRLGRAVQHVREAGRMLNAQQRRERRIPQISIHQQYAFADQREAAGNRIGGRAFALRCLAGKD